MGNLQDILNQFNETKLAKLSEGKIAQKISGYNNNLPKNMTLENREEIRKNALSLSLLVKENAKKQAILIDEWYSKDENKVSCPHCGTKGREYLMRTSHFSNCKRNVGFSDEMLYELHLKGYRHFEIAKMSNINRHRISAIIRRLKKNLV